MTGLDHLNLKYLLVTYEVSTHQTHHTLLVLFLLQKSEKTRYLHKANFGYKDLPICMFLL